MTSTDNVGYIKRAMAWASALRTSIAAASSRSLSNIFHRTINLATIISVSVIITGCGTDLTIHSPNAGTFYVPNDSEPMHVLISLPDDWNPSDNIMMLRLLDDAGTVVHTQSFVPMTVPTVSIGTAEGLIEGQMRPFAIPASTAAGWYTVEAAAFRTLELGSEIIVGESERFWISRIGPHETDAGLDVNLSPATPPPPPPWNRGGLVDVFLIDMDEVPGFETMGFNCGDPGEPIAMLHKVGSHGDSHRHWLLTRTEDLGIVSRYTLPDDVPAGSDYFIWVTKGPRCNGTSDYFEIAAP